MRAPKVATMALIMATVVGYAVDPSGAERRRVAEPFVVEDVAFSMVPTREVFEHGDEVELDVRVVNRSDGERFLGISVPSAREGRQRTTLVTVSGEEVEVAGLPCYIHARHGKGWNLRICEAGYSDRYRESPLRLMPGARAAFQIRIPQKPAAGNTRPTGRLDIFSRFAVARTAEGPKTVGNGPETTLVVVSRKSLDPAVRTLTEALAGVGKTHYEVAEALAGIERNPLPECVPLILRAIRHDWRFDRKLDRSLWSAASVFVSRSIYAEAVAAAAREDVDDWAIEAVYWTVYRNRQYLKREDVLRMLARRRFKDTQYGETRNTGYQATMLLAMVAEEEDIPRLAEMCAHFMPPTIGHDITHHAYNRRLAILRDGFMRHPDASRRELRKAFARAMVPREFPPWRRAFERGGFPHPAMVFGEWLSQLGDVEAIPVIEHFATHGYPSSKLGVGSSAPELLARIDGPDAMRALRRIGSAGLRERAKLGDPRAIDKLLDMARCLAGSPYDDTMEGTRLVLFVRSLLEPDSGLVAWPPRKAVEFAWQKRRQGFVNAFVAKYGFDPDADAPGPTR